MVVLQILASSCTDFGKWDRNALAQVASAREVRTSRAVWGLFGAEFAQSLY